MKKIIIFLLLFIFTISNINANNKNEYNLKNIWNNIEKKTSKYSNKRKRKSYKKLLSQLNNYITKNKNSEKKEIINTLIINLEIEINNLIEIYDKTDDFYKKSLQISIYSCEVSSSADILSTILNKNITEDELIKKIDKDWFGKKALYSNGLYIWGNPDKGYVGHINKDDKGNIASQRNLTGYGVYEKPITKLYNDYGFETKIINNKNYTDNYGPDQHLYEILKEFKKGNYVQLWGDICTTPKNDDGELKLSEIKQEDVDNGKNAKNYCWSFGQDRKRVWYYRENGKLIKHQGLIGEHNFYLLGYKGEMNNPEIIIVWDTSTGRHEYPIYEWLRKWEEMDYRSIIIYNK